MKKVRIGVIGLGRLGYHHAMNVTKTQGAVLQAVCDGFPEALNRAVNDFDVKGYSDYKEMIVSDDIDAIVVATPTQTHYDVLIDCIETGKPIFCEKPITFTLEEAEKIVKLVEEKNIFMQIGLAFLTIVLTVVILFAMTSAWYTNIAQTSGLVFEVEPDEINILKDLVIKIMSSTYELRVPLEVDYEIGDNWYDAK